MNTESIQILLEAGTASRPGSRNQLVDDADIRGVAIKWR